MTNKTIIIPESAMIRVQDLAAKLAEHSTEDECYDVLSMSLDDVYLPKEDGQEIRYTPAAQEVYDRLRDEYEELIMQYAVPNVAGFTLADIYQRAEEDEVELSPLQAGEVFLLMEKRHDASIGMNWDIISLCITTVVEKGGEA